MKATDCKRFDSCSAQICPLNGFGGIWYPDEEICRSSSYSGEAWLQNQKKIAKRTRDFDSYYSFKMLQHNCVIGKGMRGLDPDSDLADMEKDETKWLNEHPEKPTVNEAKREQLRNRIAEARSKLNPNKKYTNRLDNLNSEQQSV